MKKNRDIKTIVKNCISREVTKERIDYWFGVFNEEIFEGQLVPFDEIVIKRTRGYLGMVSPSDNMDEFELTMRNNLTNDHFLGTLGHEMVHLYQGQIEHNYKFPEPEDKNPVFNRYIKKFNEFGIDIV